MENVEQTIISQYAASATIVQLVKNMNGYIDPAADLLNFYNYVWNVSTAQGFGLDPWGRIVDIARNVNIVGPTPGTYVMPDDAYRLMILTKAMVNIAATTSPALNQILQNMFPGRGRCYVNDLGLMRMRYTFEFPLADWEYAIVTTGGLLPHPGGVAVSVLPLQPPLFGFVEQGIITASPWNVGAYYSQVT